MRTVRLTRLVAIALSLAAMALPTVGSPVKAYAASGEMNAEEAAYAAELARLTLQERQARNLAPLGEHASLTRAAVLFAQYLAQPGVLLDHTADGRTPIQRADAQGYHTGTYWTTCGENIAGNFTTPAACFAAWMASPGHQANIITDMPSQYPARRHLATGVCIANGKTIAVQMFGVQMFLTNPSPTPTPTPTPTPKPTPTPLPTPRSATLNIAARQAGTLTVTVPVAAKARTLTVSVTGSPIVAPVSAGVLANQTKTVTLNISASTAARVATARTTDGTAAPTLRFVPRTGPTPAPGGVTPTAQVVTVTVPARVARTLTVTVPVFARARTLSISVTGAPALAPITQSLPANTSRTVRLSIPASTTMRTVTVRVSDGPRPTVL